MPNWTDDTLDKKFQMHEACEMYYNEYNQKCALKYPTVELICIILQSGSSVLPVVTYRSPVLLNHCI